MKKEIIGQMLRDNRKSNQLSVNQVAEKLKENNNPVSPKTIYGWESGNTQPDVETLLFLCNLYNIDNVMETFGYDVKKKLNIVATDWEIKLLKAYRNHPEMQEAIHKLLDLIQ